METLGVVLFKCVTKIDERIKDQVEIKWYHNETMQLNPTDTHQLILNGVTKDNEGSYTCSVATPFGSLNQTGNLAVLGEPPTFISTEKNVRTIEGGSATLSCQANGLPLPKIYWQKQNSNLTSDVSKFYWNQRLGDLKIRDITQLDEG